MSKELIFGSDPGQELKVYKTEDVQKEMKNLDALKKVEDFINGHKGEEKEFLQKRFDYYKKNKFSPTRILALLQVDLEQWNHNKGGESKTTEVDDNPANYAGEINIKDLQKGEK